MHLTPPKRIKILLVTQPVNIKLRSVGPNYGVDGIKLLGGHNRADHCVSAAPEQAMEQLRASAKGGVVRKPINKNQNLIVMRLITISIKFPTPIKMI